VIVRLLDRRSESSDRYRPMESLDDFVFVLNIVLKISADDCGDMPSDEMFRRVPKGLRGMMNR
jgi:hypothetical protein